MSKIQMKHLGAIGIVAGVLLLSGCTRTERAFVAGAAVGAIVASYDHPRYYDRPYYYYNGMYYYGGYYDGGYYYYKGHRMHGGHYYHDYYEHHHHH